MYAAFFWRFPNPWGYQKIAGWFGRKSGIQKIHHWMITRCSLTKDTDPYVDPEFPDVRGIKLGNQTLGFHRCFWHQSRIKKSQNINNHNRYSLSIVQECTVEEFQGRAASFRILNQLSGCIIAILRGHKYMINHQTNGGVLRSNNFPHVPRVETII